MSLESSQLENILRVVSFCLHPKERALLERCDLLAYFNDGQPPEQVARLLGPDRLTLSRSCQLLITGADNLIEAAHGGLHRASDFRDALVQRGQSAEWIHVDDMAIHTHRQAESLLRFVRASEQNERGTFRSIGLITAWHHALRAWLTVVEHAYRAQMAQDVCVVPCPQDEFNFASGIDSQKLVDGEHPSAWQYVRDCSIPRLMQYQQTSPPDVASWERAAEYIVRLERAGVIS